MENTRAEKQKRNLKMLGVCIVVLCALFAVLKLWPYSQQDGEASEDQGESILALETADVVALSYEHEGYSTSFSLKDGVWYSDADADFPLAQTAISDMLDAVCTLSTKRILSSPPQRYGTDEPQISVEITLKDGTAHKVCLGDQNLTTYDYYCTVDGSEDIYMVIDDVALPFTAVLNDLADLEGVPAVLTANVLSFSVKQRGSALTAVRYADGQPAADYTGELVWFVRSGNSYTGLDSSRVSSWINSFASTDYSALASSNCSAAQYADYGLDSPSATITMEYNEVDSEGNVTGQNEFVLLCGTVTDGGYTPVCEPGSRCVYFMDSETVQALLGTEASDLVYEQVCGIALEDVQSMAINCFGDSYNVEIERELTRDDDGNTVTTSTYTVNGREVDSETFTAFYNFLVGLSYQSTLESNYSLADADITVTFERDNEYFPSVTLSFAPYDDSFYASKIDSQRPLLINSRNIETLAAYIKALS